MAYKEIINRLDDHAKAHYEEGFDGWIETLDYEEKLDIIHGAHDSYEACYARFIDWVADYAQSDAIRAENCALYEEHPQYCDHIKANAEARRAEAKEWANKVLPKELPYEKVEVGF